MAVLLRDFTFSETPVDCTALGADLFCGKGAGRGESKEERQDDS